MARSLGIPARIATGYTSGKYNPFTGLYEVKASFAHAWVEVYFPGYGWSTFDPTPGYDSTPWEYRDTGNMQGGQAFGFIAGKVGEVIGPTLKPVGSLIRGVASLDPASIIIAACLLGGASLAFIYGRKRLALIRRRASLNPQRSVKVSDARLYSRYKAITSAFEEAGVVCEEYETPEEFSRRAARELEEPGVARLGEIYLYARFRNAVPAEMAEEFGNLEPDALAAAERLKEAQKVRG